MSLSFIIILLCLPQISVGVLHSNIQVTYGARVAAALRADRGTVNKPTWNGDGGQDHWPLD